MDELHNDIQEETHVINIKKANEYIEKNKGKVDKRFRLKYHVMPPCGWINDPNGLIKFNGEYHVFFQYYPYEAKWGPMHWGHAKSKDLIHFDYLPVALAPSESYDFNETSGGCFSGSAVDDDGKLTLIYTGCVDGKNPPQVQCIAVSYDGVVFNKYGKNPVIPCPPQDGSYDFRDPKVWKHNGLWYLVAGSCKDGIGKALLYTSNDLRNWNYEGVLAQSSIAKDSVNSNNSGKKCIDGEISSDKTKDELGFMGYMWECPDMFHMNGADVLMVSPMGMEGHKNIFLIGKMDYKTKKFIPDRIQEVDLGPDFYAAQTFVDNGRRILMGWMESWQGSKPTEMDGWAGALTIPRELTVGKDGNVLSKPLEEFKSMRDEYYGIEFSTLDSDIADKLNKINVLKGKTLEIKLDVKINKPIGSIELMVRCSKDLMQHTKIKYDAEKGELTVDRDNSGIGDKGVYSYKVESCEVNLDMFLDTSSMEIFLNGGQKVMSFRIYPDEASEGIRLINNLLDSHVKLDIWKLKI